MMCPQPGGPLTKTVLQDAWTLSRRKKCFVYRLTILRPTQFINHSLIPTLTSPDAQLQLTPQTMRAKVHEEIPTPVRNATWILQGVRWNTKSLRIRSTRRISLRQLEHRRVPAKRRALHTKASFRKVSSAQPAWGQGFRQAYWRFAEIKEESACNTQDIEEDSE
jgi:hypothetical protein